ncbi:MAG TPA: hypothetical protein VHG10_00930 [Glycomyces sp.]|nr:hypothetical protein [Glycomyces sp.]
MQRDQLANVAFLMRQRNDIDARIADIVGRPVVSGHLSDWIAAAILDIALERAANRAIDGRFRSGPLAGRTVNIRHYTQNQGLLDMTDSEELDYYLVMTGPRGPAVRSAGTHRPWTIDYVHLFDAWALADALHAEMRRIGTATSVRAAFWHAAEIHPRAANPELVLTPEQALAFDAFKSGPSAL